MRSYRLYILLSILWSSCLPAAGDFALTIVNKTNNPAVHSLYIIVKGINPTTNNQCFIQFQQDGKVGTYVDIAKTTNAHDFSYEYRYFKDQPMHLPNLVSGRIYVSINKKLTMPIVIDARGKFGIADPSPYNTSDPNFDLFFDKIEFTYIGENTWTNPTAVDFFALPLLIQQAGHSYGMTQSRTKVMQAVNAAFEKAPSNAWKKLIIKNKQGTIVRILAPGRDNTYFDPDYLTAPGYNYVNDVWNYYTTHTIRVDCSELRGNPAAPALQDYIFTGRVSNDIFTFTNTTKDHSVSITKPSSNSFFLGAQGAFDAPNNTPKAIIVRNLSAAWCVGLLPTENNTLLRRDYFDKHRSEFYTHNPRLSPASKGKGPFYNLYGKAIHALSTTLYTWAYDDAFGYDGTNASKGSNPATLIIGDMSGTRIATS